ncbi:hypothetical protein ACI8B_270022 [Acinetobacter proteolyticus]|uniref:Uncharacterized protein n=1 Tax=Acinetobacter proteolyticus TaxID=1776741 RepID=A0A653K5X0_9GAMM|nr:hypothetical protein ACI8B_270022 [Acinetobacter proteolyticus]
MRRKEEVKNRNSTHGGLLYVIEVLPNHCQLIRVAERKGVDRLDIQTQHTLGCPLPALPQREGDEWVSHRLPPQKE